MDEIGSNIGPETNGIVLGPAEKSTTLTKGGGNREWVTVIECISAAGAYTRPTIIFERQIAPTPMVSRRDARLDIHNV